MGLEDIKLHKELLALAEKRLKILQRAKSIGTIYGYDRTDFDEGITREKEAIDHAKRCIEHLKNLHN